MADEKPKRRKSKRGTVPDAAGPKRKTPKAKPRPATAKSSEEAGPPELGASAARKAAAGGAGSEPRVRPRDTRESGLAAVEAARSRTQRTRVTEAEEDEPAVGRRKTIILVALIILLAIMLAGFWWYYNNREVLLPSVEVGRRSAIAKPRFLFMFDGGVDNHPLNTPTDVQINPVNGYAYVTDTDNGRVSVFTRLGKWLYSFSNAAGGPMKKPVFLSFDSSGNVWVTDRAREKLFVFKPDGKFIQNFQPPGMGFWQPIAVYIDPNDRVYVSDVQKTHRVLVFDIKGKLLFKIGKQGLALKSKLEPKIFAFPSSIAVDQETGDIFIADTVNRRLQKFDKDGKYLKIIPTGGLPRGIVFTYRNRLAIVDQVGNSVMVYNAEGTPLVTFGEWGINEAQFYYPAGIGTSNDKRWIYVTDTQNDRVEVWGWPVTAEVPTAARACPWVLPLLLLPLLLLLLRRKKVAHEDFLELVVEGGKVRLFRDKIKKALCLIIVFRVFEEIEQDEVRMKDVLKPREYNRDRAKSLQDEYDLDEETAALLSISRRGFRLRKTMLFVDDEYTRKVAKKLRIETMSYLEFLEKYEGEQTPEPEPDEPSAGDASDDEG